MAFEEPLEDIIYFHERNLSNKERQSLLEPLQNALNELDVLLAKPASDKIDLTFIRAYGFWNLFPLESDILGRIYRLHEKIIERRGKGSAGAEDTLLRLVAVSADLTSIPFWLKIVDIKLPSDLFSRKRKSYAVAALAYLAFYKGYPTASDAIIKLISNPNPQVRSETLKILVEVIADREKKLSHKIIDNLEEVALNDSDFETRYHTRRLLEISGKPLPLENPNGTYCFKVNFVRSDWYRILEIKSEHCLDTLHTAIQESIGWDSDHLYRFFMNGKYRDVGTTIKCPFDVEEEGSGLCTCEAVIGNLSLKKGHKFLYLFDYGDDHVFEIRVTAVNPNAGPGEYPRLVESVGDAPEQYPRWDDDWE